MLRDYFSHTYYLLFLESSIIVYHVKGRNVVDKTEVAVSGTDGFSAALNQLKQNCLFKTEDTLIVGLPLRLFSLVNFSLPSSAEENLDEAISYELMRYVPYDLESCLFHATTTPREDSLQIHVTLALSDSLQPYLAALSAAGLSASAITPTMVLAAWMTDCDGIYLHCPGSFAEFLVYRHQNVDFLTTIEVADGDRDDNFSTSLAVIHNHQLEADPFWVLNPNQISRDIVAAWPQLSEQPTKVDIATGNTLPAVSTLPYRIDLISSKALRKKRARVWFKVAAVFIFLLSLLFYPTAFIAGKYTELRTLEDKLNIVRQQAQTLDSLRQENQEMIKRYETLADYVRSRPQVLNALKEIADIVPLDTYLNSLQLNGRHLILRGTAVEATAVIEVLAASPLLEDVQFDSPVVKKGARETFTIVANLK